MSDAYPKALSVRQAATRIGCSTQTVRRWLDEGKLPKYLTHPTRRVRIPEDAVRKATQLYPSDTD